MTTTNTSDNSPITILRKRKGTILLLLLFVGFAYVAIPQLGFFNTNWAILFHSDRRYLGAAAFALLVSFAAASVVYMQLSPKKLRFGATYIVQVASAFAGKVLPIGLGSISVNYLYLRKRGCKQAIAATVVAVNNLLGIVGNGLWLLLVVIFLPEQVAALTIQDNLEGWIGWALLLGGLVLLGGIFAFRKRLWKAMHDVIKQLQTYRQQPARLFVALLASMTLTACNVLIVWLAAQALNVPLGFVAAAIAMTTGVLAQSVTPTPGGLGGVEAGLVGGLALSGVQLENAVSVTILFRLITYWLPLALGGLALVTAVRRKLL